MKKVKFTLGLALAILFIGANFVDAAKEVGFRTDKGSQTSIGYTFYVNANPQFVKVQSVLRDYSYGNSRAIFSPGRFQLDTLVNLNNNMPNDTLTKKDWYGVIFGTSYYYNTTIRRNARISYGTDGWGLTTNCDGIWSIYDRNYNLYNDIIIELDYVEGIEIMPSVKRTIVYGEWYFETDDKAIDINGFAGKDWNRLAPANSSYAYLQPANDSVTFRPYHDRKDGVARFVYHQEVQELFNKLPIFSISYEITIHDEIGTLGEEANEPPLMIDPVDMRGLKFDIGSGITTTIPINTIGNTLYVPSNKHFTFTVFSDKEIIATSDRSNDPNDGIIVEKDNTQANAYKVTVKRVQSNFTVKVVQKSGSQSGEGEGTTGNEGAATDAVWGANGTLYVNAATPGAISIYSVTGQLFRQEAISGSYTLSMPKGLYIVQFNGKAYKVVL